jgi:hypothetical protein
MSCDDMMQGGANESQAFYRRVTPKGVEVWKRSTEIRARPAPATATPRRHPEVPNQEVPRACESSLTPLRKMAIKWMRAELDFYRGSKDRSEYSPWMNDDNRGSQNVNMPCFFWEGDFSGDVATT